MSDKVIMMRIGDNVYRFPISTPTDDIALAADILENTALINSKVTTLNTRRNVSGRAACQYIIFAVLRGEPQVRSTTMEPSLR